MTSQDIHVEPLADLLPHDCTGPDCMCDPAVLVEGAVLIYAHNSYDGREDHERPPAESADEPR